MRSLYVTRSPPTTLRPKPSILRWSSEVAYTRCAQSPTTLTPKPSILRRSSNVAWTRRDLPPSGRYPPSYDEPMRLLGHGVINRVKTCLLIWHRWPRPLFCAARATSMEKVVYKEGGLHIGLCLHQHQHLIPDQPSWSSMMKSPILLAIIFVSLLQGNSPTLFSTVKLSLFVWCYYRDNCGSGEVNARS